MVVEAYRSNFPRKFITFALEEASLVVHYIERQLIAQYESDVDSTVFKAFSASVKSIHQRIKERCLYYVIT